MDVNSKLRCAIYQYVCECVHLTALDGCYTLSLFTATLVWQINQLYMEKHDGK